MKSQAKRIKPKRGKLYLRRFREEVRFRNDRTRKVYGFWYSNFVETIARGERMNDEHNRRIIDSAKRAVGEGCKDTDQIVSEVLNIALWTVNTELGKEAVGILQRLGENHSIFMIANSAKNQDVRMAAGNVLGGLTGQ